MTNATFKILMTTSLIALGSGAALARDRGGEPMSFETLDVDGSGEITAEDLAALADNRFDGFDTNGDGSVSQDEFVAAHVARAEERAAEMFARLDADGDGALSRDVLESRRGGERRGARMIERFDTDGSGGVSAEEFEEARAHMRERRGERRGFGKHRH